MTTIAWDGRTLAVDRCRLNGRGTRQEICKMRHAGGYVFAIAGDLADLPVIERWLRRGARFDERPEMVDQQNPTCGIAVRKRDRRLFWIEGSRSMIVELPPGPTAAGSGAPYALAAMHCGRDACAAVAVAARFDDGTGFGWDAWPHGTCRVELPAMPVPPLPEPSWDYDALLRAVKKNPRRKK